MWLPAAGGALIGASASLLLLTTGRRAGVSGVVSGLLEPGGPEAGWRAAFFVGLLAGGLALLALLPGAIPATGGAPLGVVAIAGVLVGFGARMGGGCTSGHGVCGVARSSKRSLAATATFLACGIATAVVAGALGAPR